MDTLLAGLRKAGFERASCSFEPDYEVVGDGLDGLLPRRGTAVKVTVEVEIEWTTIRHVFHFETYQEANAGAEYMVARLVLARDSLTI